MGKQSIAVIGECMIELSNSAALAEGSIRSMNMSFGGDTLNCALYMARLGGNVDYVTALGDDDLSQWMISAWKAEGIHCDSVKIEQDGLPALYMIVNDPSGERFFHYWRNNSPARRLLDNPTTAASLFNRLNKHQYVFLSGVTLAIYSDQALDRLFQWLGEYREIGGRVVFDGNFRPRLWSSLDRAREVYETMYRVSDLVLSTNDDERALFSDLDDSSILLRLSGYGIGEIVLKQGELGCTVVNSNETHHIPANAVTVVDTTSAGDSFNAGYLTSRMNGLSVKTAAEAGHRLASVVIQHKGAIIPIDAMPVIN